MMHESSRPSVAAREIFEPSALTNMAVESMGFGLAVKCIRGGLGSRGGAEGTA
jgi:hypothetical protein